MDDRIRVSDADREEVAARLREHFAQGRISSEELDERITAALSAKTAGDLRRVLTDLPGPSPVQQAGPAVPWGRPGGPRGGFPVGVFRRGPRLLPLVVFALIASLLLPGAGWVFFAFFQFLLVMFLAVSVTGIVMAARFRRNLRRNWQSGNGPYWRQYQWHN
ncbi:MAG TPA: DUF1707 domain-containing protein [Streptosporangiaceae bacterium]|nr:DUF1707 domain-containing protein [Streptosporangiaceae bacterium]